MERAGALFLAGPRPPSRATRAEAGPGDGKASSPSQSNRPSWARPEVARGQPCRTRNLGPAWSQPGQGAGPRRRRWGKSAAAAAVGARAP